MKSNFIVECDICGAKLPLNSITIDSASVDVCGSEFTLNYFTCSKCDHIFKVLLFEEQKYNKLLDDMLATKKRISKLKGKGTKEQIAKLQEMAFKKEQKIQRYTERINKKYRGTFTFKTSENGQKEIVYIP